MATPDRLAGLGPGEAGRPGKGPATVEDEEGLNFAAVVERHGKSLRRRALWLTKDESDAADLFQETMERAIRSTRRYVESAALARWLFTIMNNAFLDHRRAQAVRRPSPEGARAVEQLPQHSPAALQAWRIIDDDVMRSCVRRLPPTMRDVFELHLQGSSYADVAHRLGIPVTTVGTRLLRARRRLRELLVDVGAADDGDGDDFTTGES